MNTSIIITNNNQTNYSFCNNCGKIGHSYTMCKSPITSIGIISYRFNPNIKDYEFLMIMRKDSLGYVDFIRGKYNLYNKQYIMNIIDEMTVTEKNNLLTKDFNELWNDLWGFKNASKNREEYKLSYDKFKIFKEGIHINNDFYCLEKCITESSKKNQWIEPEWGFPKGRRNYKENDLKTALREFCEETGYKNDDINIINNLIPFEETFVGSNFKLYKHKYFIAKIDYNNEYKLNDFQKSEVSKIEWKKYEDVLKSLRPYNLERLDIIMLIHKILKKYEIL
jgi:8-oxo-dGTP pyrophosphatase MutT (NUDIX family)